MTRNLWKGVALLAALAGCNDKSSAQITRDPPRAQARPDAVVVPDDDASVVAPDDDAGDDAADPADAADAGDACSKDLASDPDHCGACGSRCAVSVQNAHATCMEARCGWACDEGFVRDGARDACVAITAPRPVAPLSTSTVTSRRPTLRWALSAPTDGAHVEICRDRACETVLQSFDVSGVSGAPPLDLPAGTVYWRMRGRVGTATGTAPSHTWAFTVSARGTALDNSWGSAFDVNGDGFADVAVAAPEGPRGRRVYVYHGSSSGLLTTPAAALDVAALSVANAGDVNGDGFSDLVVATATALNVYRGGASGVSATPIVTPVGTGLATHAPAALAAAGDLNRDGYADLVVGAPAGCAGSACENPDYVYVYLGGPTGLTLGVTLSNGIRHFGYAVAGGADVNGDGFHDVVVAVSCPAIYTESDCGSDPRQLQLYLGSAAGLRTSPAARIDVRSASFGAALAMADVNGDGFADVLGGDPTAGPAGEGQVLVFMGSRDGLATAPAMRITGADGSSGAFGAAMTNAGDVNGDGYADVVLGAPCAPHNGNHCGAGRAHAYPGGPSGLGAPAGTLTGFDRTALAIPGDINGDGFADAVLGAPRDSAAGRAAIYHGSATGFTAMPATVLMGRDEGSAFGTSVAGMSAGVAAAPRVAPRGLGALLRRILPGAAARPTPRPAAAQPQRAQQPPRAQQPQPQPRRPAPARVPQQQQPHPR